MADMFAIIFFDGAARRADYILDIRGLHFNHKVEHLLPREAFKCTIGFLHFPRADTEDR